MKKIIKYFFIGLTAILLSIAVISYISLRKLIFKSDPIVHGQLLSITTKKIKEDLVKNYKVEEVFFNTDDNIKIAGFLIRREKAKGNLILCHGFQRSKEMMRPYLDFFEDYNILMFDFRAQGQSEGKIITLGLTEYHDVIAASNFIKSKFDKKLPIIVLGVSMGAAASLMAAFIKPDLCSALISDSVFKDLVAVVENSFTFYSGLPKFPFVFFIRFFAKNFYNCDVSKLKPIEFIKNIHIPIFFIHSSSDSIVPTEHTLSLYKSVEGNGSQLWITPPAFHADSSRHYPQEYKERIKKFLSSII